jgi:DNA-binding NarL/FixJ family response regulator
MKQMTQHERAASLSRRERQIVNLVAQGLTNRQIAEILLLSAGTIGNYIHRIYLKLAVSERSQIKEYADL